MKETNRCPLCQSGSLEFVFTSHNRHGRHDINTKDTLTIKRCANCDVVFTADIKTDAEYYKKYYDTGYYDSGKNDSLAARAVKILESWSLKKKETILLKYAPKRSTKLKILDVGCGTGKFLERLDTKKFEKYGSEINTEGIKISRKKGITIYEKDITKINFGNEKFDIITLWHVLEHLTDPIGVYKKAHTLLTDDGILVFATPNTDSLGFRIGKAEWFHLDSPRHLMLFNKKSIQHVCEHTKFKIQTYINEFHDYPLDLFWSVINTPYKYCIYPFYLIIKFFDQEALTVISKKIHRADSES